MTSLGLFRLCFPPTCPNRNDVPTTARPSPTAKLAAEMLETTIALLETYSSCTSSGPDAVLLTAGADRIVAGNDGFAFTFALAIVNIGEADRNARPSSGSTHIGTERTATSPAAPSFQNRAR